MLFAVWILFLRSLYRRGYIGLTRQKIRPRLGLEPIQYTIGNIIFVRFLCSLCYYITQTDGPLHAPVTHRCFVWQTLDDYETRSIKVRRRNGS